ncbi:hypothetical protein PAMP_001139 [Pampus punctatissimus]
MKKVEDFKHLGSTVQINGECGKEVKKRVQAVWNGWRKVSGVMCDRRVSAKIKGKVYKTVDFEERLYVATDWITTKVESSGIADVTAAYSRLKNYCQKQKEADITPDLRLILVGSQHYGVDSVANTILGGEVFKLGNRTAESVTHTGQVNGKVIQLVKAPVWLRGYQLCDTAELVKEEIVLSVTCCKPGPHAFIVLVEVDLPFTNACAKAVEAHLELYGKNVWSHTVVLFTCLDWLGSTCIEEYIADEGDDLAQLLERCGQRYLTASDSTEKPLSQKLLDMVQTQRNEGKHFEIEENVLQKIYKRRDEVKKRAEIRRQIRIEEKNTQENETETYISEVTIIMLGWVFASKTRVGCAILDIPEKDERSEKCVKETRVMGKLKVNVVDTPGWWKFFSASLVPSTVKSEIMKALDQHKAMENPQDQASSSQAFLLMIPVDTSFTNEQRKIVEDNMRPLGEAVWQNTIVVFTSGFWLGKYCIEQHIESEGDALIWLVEKCGNRYFVFNCETTVKSDIETQVEKLLNMVKEMLFRGRSAAKEETRQTAESEVHTKVVASEEPVDEDLKNMVEYLYRIWCWRSWEVEEVVARFDERPMQVRTCDNESMDRKIYCKYILCV